MGRGFYSDTPVKVQSVGPAVQGVHKFAELVEEKSGGRMHIDVFANAQLASDRDCIEGMQMNTIQSGIMVSSALAGFTDELLVFDLPFLFENSAQGQAVCDSDVGQQILGTLEDIGIDPNSPKMENLFQDLFHSPFMEPTAENEARLRKAMHYLSAD